MYNTPILFLTFNRPQQTRLTFQLIRKIKPRYLYIAQDGPRNFEETQLTNQVKNIITEVDWDCNAKYLIQKNNLGCKDGINTAIDWFFMYEEMGIILEDDILPDRTFFEFSAELLEKYKHDTRIMMISGNNLLGEYKTGYDYFFTKIGAIWGWATWRRVWQMHDKDIASWPKIKNEKVLYKILSEDLAQRRSNNIDEVYFNKINTWDYQFTYTRLINSGLSIIPSVNLIENIGFDVQATHTTRKPEAFDNIKRSINTKNIKHPIAIVPDDDFDQLVFTKYNPKESFLKKLKRNLSKLKRKLIRTNS